MPNPLPPLGDTIAQAVADFTPWVLHPDCITEHPLHGPEYDLGERVLAALRRSTESGAGFLPHEPAPVEVAA